MKFYSNKKIAVTGHTGFKGSWLTAAASLMGARVSGFSLNPEHTELFEVSRRMLTADVRGDVRDRQAVANFLKVSKPDVVFHLAAQPLVRESYINPLGTLDTNVMGIANVLEAIRSHCPHAHCVVITSDKCYENRGWDYAYRESDHLGGRDIYSASKGAAEIVTAAWRRSFFESSEVTGRVATARGGNVIGGGDFSVDRIVPDAVRSIRAKKTLIIRNPRATRPWQHVVDCLFGYLKLGAWLSSADANKHLQERSFNIGPAASSEKSVEELVREIFRNWPGKYMVRQSDNAPHEASRLRLANDKASAVLRWRPCWGFEEAVSQTVVWYKAWSAGATQKELLKIMEQQIQAVAEAS
jgi:CDP-glucose 4,6-dehydratase